MIAHEEYAANWGQPTQGLLFPPEVLAKVKVINVKCCRHPRVVRIVGPRIKAVYGSLPTIVCPRCWHYKIGELEKEWGGKWSKDTIYDAVARREVEDYDV